jgi:hypothetical protein
MMAQTNKRKRSTEDARGARHYLWKGKRYTSVTTILGCLPKQEVLVPWGTKAVAKWCIDHYEELGHLIEVDPEVALDTAKTAHKRITRDAAVRGTTLHEYAERHDNGEDITEDEVGAELWPVVRGFLEYIDAYGVTPILAEATVYNLTQAYAGSFDGLHKWADGRNMLVDYKTGKGAYDEYACQLVAYQRGEFWDNEGHEAPLPRIDGLAVLHLTPAGCGVYEVDPSKYDLCWRTFRAAHAVYQFKATQGIYLP